MNAKIDSFLIQSVVLLNRQSLLIEHLISTQERSLLELESTLLQQKHTVGHVFNIYNYVLLLIDHLVRFHKIAHSLPRLNKKSTEFRTLDSALESFKDIRNQHQHINNDIENSYTGPLLGSICWISENIQFLVSLPDLGRERSMAGIAVNTETGEFQNQFCYIYNDIYYDLKNAFDSAQRFNEYISSTVKINVDGKSYSSDEHFIATYAKFDFLSNNTNESK